VKKGEDPDPQGQIISDPGGSGSGTLLLRYAHLTKKTPRRQLKSGTSEYINKDFDLDFNSFTKYMFYI